MKAKYLGKVYSRNGYAVHLEYEYRGHRYFVTDEHNGYSEAMSEKHRHEQDRIDREIESVQPVQEWTYKGSAQEGFDLFWDYVESGRREENE